MPEDGDSWMLQAQALFALGSYGKAASLLHGATAVAEFVLGLPRREGRGLFRHRSRVRCRACGRSKTMYVHTPANLPAIFCSATTTVIAAALAERQFARRCGWSPATKNWPMPC